MKTLIHEADGQNIAEVVSDQIIIHTAQDALDLMFDPALNGARKIILRREHIAPAFFELETGLAGDIAQKFVNYSVQLAIVGDFSRDTRSSLQAFIRESNRGRHLFFVGSTEEAVGILRDR